MQKPLSTFVLGESPIKMQLNHDFTVAFQESIPSLGEAHKASVYSPEMCYPRTYNLCSFNLYLRVQTELESREVLVIENGKYGVLSSTIFPQVSKVFTKLNWLTSECRTFFPRSLNNFLNSNATIPIVQLSEFNAVESYCYEGKIATVNSLEIESSDLRGTDFSDLMKAIGGDLIRLKIHSSKISLEDFLEGLKYCSKLKILDTDVFKCVSDEKFLKGYIKNIEFVQLVGPKS